jgi:hypothetical protein
LRYSRLLLSAFVAFAAFFTCGFLIEGLLIRQDFAPYTAVYRSIEALKPLMPIGMLGAFTGILILTVLYAKSGMPANFPAALRFGLLAGLFVSLVYPLSNFVILNIGWRLGLETTLSAFVQWTVAGLVIALLYRPAAADRR